MDFCGFTQKGRDGILNSRRQPRVETGDQDIFFVSGITWQVAGAAARQLQFSGRVTLVIRGRFLIQHQEELSCRQK